MLIENKWVLRETRGNMYYVKGDTAPVFEALSSRTRRYKAKKDVEAAIRQIKRLESCEYAPEYIERREVPDAPQDKPSKPTNKPSEPPVIKYDEGWEIIDAFGKRILYLRKKAACSYIYAVLDGENKLRGFGFDELKAWLWYSDLRRDVGAKRIEERSGKQQSSGRGNAEK